MAQSKARRVGFILCAVLFAAGCVAGVASAAALPPDTRVGAYIAGLSEGSISGVGERFFPALLSAGKYHIAALFFAFSVLGVAGIPIIAAIRGFVLCFTMSAVVRYYGQAGIPAALAVFAPEALIATPSLLMLSAPTFAASFSLLSSLPRRAAGPMLPYGAGLLRSSAVGALAVAAASLASAAIAPGLLSRLGG
ncbi:MAG: hypothetical protein LBH17_02620 [Oscillospiraceae bacterium]|jgi:hypothetical protein|nr:hypothetical protein [Oscillospiraceae bacterium]